MSLIFPRKQGCSSIFSSSPSLGGDFVHVCRVLGSPYIGIHIHGFIKGMKRSCPPWPRLTAPQWELQPLSSRWAGLTGIGLRQSQVCRLQPPWTLAALRKPFFAIKASLALVLTGARGSF